MQRTIRPRERSGPSGKGASAAPAFRRFPPSGNARFAAIVAAMNSVTDILLGLCASLCLTLGFHRLAQSLDPLSRPDRHAVVGVNGGVSMTWPSNFPART